MAAAIGRAGCREIRRDSEQPVLVIRMSCAGRPATVTFVPAGAMAAPQLEEVINRPDLGEKVQWGSALLAVSAGDESSAFLAKLQRPSAGVQVPAAPASASFSAPASATPIER